MKKSLIIAVLAGAALAGCTIDERDSSVKNDNPQQITFTNPVVHPAMTRGTAVAGEINKDCYPTNQKFFVYARTPYEGNFNTEGWTETYYISDSVAYDPNLKGWVTESPKLWPTDGKKLAFAAYSPADLSKDCNPTDGVTYKKNDGLKLAGFQVRPRGYMKSEKINESGTPITGTYIKDVQYDLMYSERTVDQTVSSITTNPGNPYSGVDIKFHHALASIVFTAKTEQDYTGEGFIFKLKDIKLNNIMSKGDFNQNIGGWNATTSNDAAWTNLSEPKEYEVILLSAYTDDRHFNIVSTVTNVIDMEASGTTQNLKGKNLILLPQTFDASSTASISITYSIKIGEDEPVEYSTTRMLKDIIFDSDTEAMWKMGKRYTYNLIFRKNIVYFNPQTDDWTDATFDGGIYVNY